MGYLEGALALAGVLAVGGLAIWLVNLGKKIEGADFLEDDVEAHNEAHRRGEAFEKAGGLRGAIQRGRATRAKRLSDAKANRDV